VQIARCRPASSAQRRKSNATRSHRAAVACGGEQNARLRPASAADQQRPEGTPGRRRAGMRTARTRRRRTRRTWTRTSSPTRTQQTRTRNSFKSVAADGTGRGRATRLGSNITHRGMGASRSRRSRRSRNRSGDSTRTPRHTRTRITGTHRLWHSPLTASMRRSISHRTCRLSHSSSSSLRISTSSTSLGEGRTSNRSICSATDRSSSVSGVINTRSASSRSSYHRHLTRQSRLTRTRT